MLDSKFFFTLVGLILAVFAICNTNISPSINEGFWGVSAPRAVKVMREVHPKGKGGCGGSYGLQNNYQAMLGSGKFFSTPAYQAALTPRFFNANAGANISYNFPPEKYQAVPSHPLGDFNRMAKEDYQAPSGDSGCSNGRCGGGCNGGCSTPNCGKGGASLSQMGSSNGGHISEDPEYVKVMNAVYDSESGPVPTDLVAVGDMSSIGADGSMEQTVVYDRYIVALQKSRLRALGDPIRGDLAITPCASGWFTASANPNIDLHEGAMAVLGGINNDTSNSLANLQYATSGGTKTISAGVNMANEFATSAGAGMSDISVSAFV